MELVNNSIVFNDNDQTVDIDGNSSLINAPKTIERLEQISVESNNRRKEEDPDEEDKLVIGEKIANATHEINKVTDDKTGVPLENILGIETLS